MTNKASAYHGPAISQLHNLPQHAFTQKRNRGNELVATHADVPGWLDMRPNMHLDGHYAMVPMYFWWPPSPRPLAQYAAALESELNNVFPITQQRYGFEIIGLLKNKDNGWDTAVSMATQYGLSAEDLHHANLIATSLRLASEYNLTYDLVASTSGWRLMRHGQAQRNNHAQVYAEKFGHALVNLPALYNGYYDNLDSLVEAADREMVSTSEWLSVTLLGLWQEGMVDGSIDITRMMPPVSFDPAFTCKGLTDTAADDKQPTQSSAMAPAL